MLNLELYIHSAAFIASDAEARGDAVRVIAREPDYTNLIQPMQLRRMSKAVRMGIGAAGACLESAGIKTPDAIAVGTTMGCLQDTEVFLKKMVSQEEQMLTPTAFIQSTHNTIAGQIALLTGCNGYNTTISQHGHSFEGAIMAAALYLKENPKYNLLCGGVDELTDTSFQLMQRAGTYIDAASHGKGAVAGEGAGFLILNAQADAAIACIKGMHVFTEQNSDVVLEQIKSSLDKSGYLSSSDALWLGISGDEGADKVYSALQEECNGTPVLFKAQSGEWGTSIAVALCRAAQELSAGDSRIFLVNHYCDDWSVFVLEHVG